jgi:cell wall-associated NlpC family hydrolase
MHKKKLLAAAITAAAFTFTSSSVFADEPATPSTEVRADASRDAGGIQKLISDALGLVGLRYKRGGTDADTGFDCSGFVGYLFKERLGLDLPRTSRDISHTGEPVEKAELQPGDLVFFNTMRRAFSHVGIYLGNNQFVHSPRSGRSVRVEDMTDRYWSKRYNGARRVDNR